MSHIYKMSAPEKINGDEPEEPDVVDQESESLGYLRHEQVELEDPSKDSNEKKRNRPWAEKDSQIRKVYINNRGKEKKMETDSLYDGNYLYKPGVELPSLYHFANQTIKIIVASEYIRRSNPELLKRMIFGTDPYTSNSDAVCMMIHTGLLMNFNNFANRRLEGVELTCKVIKPKKNYTGSFKNGIMSRSLKGYNGNALKPESIRNLPSLGPMEMLERYAANMHIPIGKNRVKSKPKNISTIVPIPETHIVFNMNNQPAYKYSIFNIADKGFEKNDFMIKKLDTFALYLETEDGKKYELLKKQVMNTFDVFSFSKVKYPDRCDNNYFKTEGCPLESDMVEPLRNNAQWEQILWGNTSVLLKADQADRNSKDIRIENLRSFKYYKKTDSK